MIPRCYTCGSDLSSIYTAFIAARRKKTLDYLDGKEIHIEKLSIAPSVDMKLSDVFEQLNIPKKKICCRVRLNTMIMGHNLRNEGK